MATPKPMIRLAHEVTQADDGQFILYEGWIPSKFVLLMDMLYPQFVTHTEADRNDGFTAFYNSKRYGTVFVGTFCGVTLQSVRRNPWLPGDDDVSNVFLRALLGGLHLRGYKHHSSVCKAKNYGTLRLWEKLGLGARFDAKGKARSADHNPDTAHLLALLLKEAKPGYADIRARANKITKALIAKEFLPTPETASGIIRRVNVELK